MQGRRPIRMLGTSALVMSVLLAGCAPGLAANPRFATDSGAHPQGEPQTTPVPQGPPPIEPVKNDLSWRECTSQVFSDASITPVPGVRLDCATYDADLDPIKGASGSISIGVVRATTNETPGDTGPLVMTTGSDLPTSAQLPVFLTWSGADVLKARPIVAVDRRGIGMSGALDCRDLYDRQAMLDQAQFQPGDDPVANLGEITQSATTSCTDTIAPGDSAYDNAHAAEDIERLRSTWDVPTLALFGIGNGAQVALAYAGSHPNKVARLVLDSPLPLGIAAEAAMEQRVKGEQSALDAWASQCVAVNCPLGPDPKSAVDAVLNQVRGFDTTSSHSVATVADAIATTLAYPRGDRVASTNRLASALAGARSGDWNAMDTLIADAETLRGTDGQFVNGCSDSLNRPTPDRVRELVVAWEKLYPQFGQVGALQLVQCLNWPSGSAPQEPQSLDAPVLLLGTAHDPIVGNEGVAAVAATVINAGASNKRVMWQGIGHGAAVYSPCALPPVIGYLDSGKLPDTDTFCPA
jgi:pimeloyl-ACP methyl ester carboxylesterase